MCSVLLDRNVGESWRLRRGTISEGMGSKALDTRRSPGKNLPEKKKKARGEIRDLLCGRGKGNREKAHSNLVVNGIAIHTSA